MKLAGEKKSGGKALIYIAAGVIALSLVLVSCGGDDGYGGGGGSVYLVAISVTPVNPSTPDTQQFMATGTYSNYAMPDITTSVTWSSSAGATISNASGSEGLATSL
jgi:hypothetical protein